MTNRLAKGALWLMLFLALFSWVAEALGADVNNLFSERGIRWMLLHGIEGGAFALLYKLLLLLLVVGTRPVLATGKERRQLLLRLLVPALLVATLILMPGSVLRGIGGHLYPGPLMHSGFTLACWCVIAVHLSLHKRESVSVLQEALSKQAHIIILFLIFALLYNEITYIWM